MRKKSKQDPNSPGAVEMVIKINNENVVIEVIPPAKDYKGEESAVADADQNKHELLPEESTPPHGEDSNMSCSSDDKSQPGPLSSSVVDRKTTHNKSEKLRRAQLKASMEKLKLLVPLEDSTQKYTTAALLRKARYLIQKLEERERKNVVFKEQLQREQRYLRKRLEQMQQSPRDGLPSVNPLTTTASQSHMQNKKTPPVQINNVKPKYPLPLATSQGQLKTPPILKRKQNFEPENTEIIFIGPSNPHDMKSSQIDLGMSPATTTYEFIATTDNYNLNTTNNISENYCIIIDAGMVQEGFPVSLD